MRKIKDLLNHLDEFPSEKKTLGTYRVLESFKTESWEFKLCVSEVKNLEEVRFLIELNPTMGVLKREYVSLKDAEFFMEQNEGLGLINFYKRSDWCVPRSLLFSNPPMSFIKALQELKTISEHLRLKDDHLSDIVNTKQKKRSL